MAQNPPDERQEQRPGKKPYGPGMLMIIGCGLLALAAYVFYALYFLGEAEEFREEGAVWKIYFNWAAGVAGVAAALYAFVLAAKRSKGGTPPAGQPPGAGAGDEADDETDEPCRIGR